MNDTGLWAGAARIDITPTVGVDLAGFLMRDGPSVGIHDPVYARALALDDGQTQALIIACDLLGLEVAFVDRIRRQIEHETGIPGAHIMIAASHTHAAPASIFLRRCGAVDPGWMADLARKLRRVARTAASSRRPSQMATTAVAGPDVSHNRRQPGGPIDPELGIARVDDTEGRPLAALLVFGCHPVAGGPGNRLISADYPGVLVDGLERATGATVLFANGACGDVNPSAVVGTRRELRRSFALVEMVGHSLTDAAATAWMGLAPSRPAPLRVASRSLSLPLQPVPAIAQLAELAATYREEMAHTVDEPSGERYRVAAAMLDWAETTLKSRRAGDVPDHVTAEIQVIALGDLALVGVPGELFAELGLAIKRAAALPRTLVLSYTNGNLGYIPTRAAYAQGGYEVDTAYRYYGYPAAVAPDAGEIVVATALELIKAVVE